MAMAPKSFHRTLWDCDDGSHLRVRFAFANCHHIFHCDERLRGFRILTTIVRPFEPNVPNYGSEWKSCVSSDSGIWVRHNGDVNVSHLGYPKGKNINQLFT